MRLICHSLLAPLFLLAIGCGGASAQGSGSAKTPGDSAVQTSGNASDDAADDGEPKTKSDRECEQVGALLQAMGDAKLGNDDETRKAFPTVLEHLARDLRKLDITSNDLAQAVDDLAATAAAGAKKIQAANDAIAEMETILAGMKPWEDRLVKRGAEVDAICASFSTCDKLNEEVSKRPPLDGEDFDGFANDLEAFITRIEKVTPNEPKVKTSVAAFIAELRSVIPKFRRMGQLSRIAEQSTGIAKDFGSKVRFAAAICHADKGI